MLHFSRAKIIAIILVCLAGLATTLPNFFSKQAAESWPAFLPHKQLSLGLDLKGGAHLLLEMDTKELTEKWLQSIREDVRGSLRTARIVNNAGIRDNAVLVTLDNPSDSTKALEELKKLVQPIGNAILGTSGTNLTVEVGEQPTLIKITPTEQAYKERLTNAIGAAVEVIRRRIDALGNVEANIVRQGAERILVQVPGFEDTAGLKALIGKTASLTFHDVHPTVSADEAQATRVPYGYKVVPSDKAEEEAFSSRKRPRSQVRIWSTRSQASTSAPTNRSSPSGSINQARANSAVTPRTMSADPSPSCSTTASTLSPASAT